VPSISAFFPAYNDAPTIAGLVHKTAGILASLTDDWEILVIDDGSTDDTAAVLAGISQPRLRVIRHAQNRGYGGALRSGFEHAAKELVFYTDGDGQYDPGELLLLWAALGDADIAQGYKIARQDPLHRVAIGRAYHHAVALAFGLGVRDVDCDFRLIRRRVLDAITLSTDSGALCVELVRKAQDAGFRFVEVPVHHWPRMHGSSQAFRPRAVAGMVAELCRLWWRL
jgi:glycosyltransferase involved in cell wall biosynthesis